MNYKDEYEKLRRRDFLREEIPKLKHELDCLENHFSNKKKVNNTIGHKKKNGCSPLLGLYNKVLYHPTAYCELKQCYLLYDDIREKACYHKDCKHLTILNENQTKKGIKNKPMKFYNVLCETERRDS